MWVRSQDLKSIQDYNGFDTEIDNDKFLIHGWKGDWRKLIGKYSKPHRCSEIMQEIQERINEGCPFVYQMPEDNNIEEE